MKQTPTQPANQDQPDAVQGEGDYKAAARYDASVKSFVESGKVDEAARNAAPGSPREADEMQKAEHAGVAHSKGEDPASRRAPERKPGSL